MNWKNRLTNYNFWISMFSAALLVLQALKIEFDIAYVNEIFTAVLGLLVVIGIISDPTRTTIKSNETKVNYEVENETLKEEKTELKSKEEKIDLPTIEKDEIDDVNFQNDFQAILNKISLDLDEKRVLLEERIRDLEKLGIAKAEIKPVTVEKEVQSCFEQITNKTDIQPAAAEMNNPYVDVIN